MTKHFSDADDYTPMRMVDKDTTIATQAAQIEALTKALKTIRFCWAGHAEECAYAKSKYRRECDCDWPKVSAECDAALAAVGEKKPNATKEQG